MRQVVFQLLVANHRPIEIRHHKIRIQLDYPVKILDCFIEVLHQHIIQSTAEVCIHIIRISRQTRRILIDRSKMFSHLIFRQGSFLVGNNQFTLQNHTRIVILDRLVVVNQLLHRVRLFVERQDKLRFDIDTHILVLHTATHLTLVFTLALFLLVIDHQTVELIDVLIRLLTGIFLLSAFSLLIIRSI